VERATGLPVSMRLIVIEVRLALMSVIVAIALTRAVMTR
jgi:hypothetical protein